MQNSAPAAAPARLPAAIEAALAIVATLPDLPPVLRAALAEILRCVSASTPGQRFRLSVAHLMERLGRSDATVDRYLMVLRSEGWICREQVKRGAWRTGWRPSWTWLTDEALDRLGLRGSIPGHAPNPSSKGEAAGRVRRIPEDLKPLETRVGAARLVWLMAKAGRVGQRVQTHLAGALAADDPVGYVLAALRRPAGHTALTHQTHRADTPGGHVGESYRYCGNVFAAADTGPRTEAGRLAGLAMLRAIRSAAAP